MASLKPPPVGTRFGKLVVVGPAPWVWVGGRRRHPWLLRCDCGNEVARLPFNVTAAGEEARCPQCWLLSPPLHGGRRPWRGHASVGTYVRGVEILSATRIARGQTLVGVRCPGCGSPRSVRLDVLRSGEADRCKPCADKRRSAMHRGVGWADLPRSPGALEGR